MKIEGEQDSRSRIVAAAEELFFMKGYEGASMRMIAQGAGCSTGLAYHYYPSKDQLLDAVIEDFLARYRVRFDAVLADETTPPKLRLFTFFQTLGGAVEEFRGSYAGMLHWTIRYAIRERALSLLEPYVLDILARNVEEGMPPLPVSKEVLATMLTHSLGSLILHENREQYKRATQEIRTEINLMLGQPANPEVFQA